MAGVRLTTGAAGTAIPSASPSGSAPWCGRTRSSTARRGGGATLLMEAAGHLARDRGITTLGITAGLSGQYGPAQRMYGRRGYIPDGRDACQGQRPLSQGMQVSMGHDLITWLTKDHQPTTQHRHRGK